MLGCTTESDEVIMEKMAICFRKQEYDKAPEYESKCDKNNIYKGYCAYYAGVIHEYIKRDLSTALKYYKKSTESNFSNGFISIANYYMNINNEDKVKKYLEKSIEIDNNSYGLFCLGLYYEKVGMYDKMSEYYLKVLQSTNSTCINYVSERYRFLGEMLIFKNCCKLAIGKDNNTSSLYELATYHNKKKDNMCDVFYEKYIDSYLNNQFKINTMENIFSMEDNNIISHDLKNNKTLPSYYHFNLSLVALITNDINDKYSKLFKKYFDSSIFTDDYCSELYHNIGKSYISMRNDKGIDYLKKAYGYGNGQAIYDCGKYLYDTDREYKSFMKLALSKNIPKAKNFL